MNATSASLPRGNRLSPGQFVQGTLAVARREVAAYFDSPIAYVYTIAFVLLANSIFMNEFFLAGRAVSAKSDAPWETVVKLVRRNKAASAVGGLAAALLLIAVSVGYHTNSQQRQQAEEQRDLAQQALEGHQLQNREEAGARMVRER